MLFAIILCVFILSIVLLCELMLIIIMLSVVTLNIVMLSAINTQRSYAASFYLVSLSRVQSCHACLFRVMLCFVL
jgi:hypothetical protein